MRRRQYVTHSFSFPFVDIEKLYIRISSLLNQTQVSKLQESRFKTLLLHWKIGRLIIEYEHQRAMRTEGHQELLSQLSEWFIKRFGKKFDLFTIKEDCKAYLIYPPFSKKSEANENAEVPQFQSPLTRNDYHLLICMSCSKVRNFYEKKASNSNWFPPSLKQFTKSHLFEKLSTSINKENALRFVQQRSLALFAKNNNYLDNFMDI